MLFYLQNPYRPNIIDRRCRRFLGWLRRQVWARAPLPLPRLRSESVRTARAAAVKEGWAEGPSVRTGRFYGTAKIEPLGTRKIWSLHRSLRYQAEGHRRNWRTKIFIYPKFKGTCEVLKETSIRRVVFGCGTEHCSLPCVLYSVHVKS
jgi:hypothetical protein